MKKILIVEDDRFLANAYKLAFENEKYEVEVAIDGEEALVMLKKNPPSIVILDILLPLRDGFSVLEEMKRTTGLEKIPVIIASNLGQKSDFDKGKKLGANDYIVKSDTSLAEVITKIKALIG